MADTWNSRIQKFDAQGNFVTMWGVFDTTQGELGDTRDLYGPRQLAIGGDGDLYVTDTGNKRIMVFKPDGTFVAQFGGQGLDNGHLDEPTGVAVDRSGNIYIADTWNHRIQKFDSQFRYVTQWAINGWASQTVVNKPAIAVELRAGSSTLLTRRITACWLLAWMASSKPPGGNSATTMLRSHCRQGSRWGPMGRSTWPTATRTGSWCSRHCSDGR